MVKKQTSWKIRLISWVLTILTIASLIPTSIIPVYAATGAQTMAQSEIDDTMVMRKS